MQITILVCALILTVSSTGIKLVEILNKKKSERVYKVPLQKNNVRTTF